MWLVGSISHLAGGGLVYETNRKCHTPNHKPRDNQDIVCTLPLMNMCTDWG